MDKSKGLKKEIANAFMSIWETKCTPSGTSSLEESFELLRKNIWVAKKIEANRIKVDKDPSGNKMEHFDIGQCPRSYSYFILFAFRKMYEQKRLVHSRTWKKQALLSDVLMLLTKENLLFS